MSEVKEKTSTNKLITIPGTSKIRGSILYKLNIICAKDGKDLKNWIQDLLIKKAKRLDNEK